MSKKEDKQWGGTKSATGKEAVLDIKPGDRVKVTIEGRWENGEVRTDDGATWFQFYYPRLLPGVTVEKIVRLPGGRFAQVIVKGQLLHSNEHLLTLNQDMKWTALNGTQVSSEYVREYYVRTVSEGETWISLNN